MIRNMFETHLQVSRLSASIEFYQRLGLELAHAIEERGAAFFWVGAQRQMLGLWEVPPGTDVQVRHFAFGVELEDLLAAGSWLRERGIEPVPAFGWMPAASVYFHDPDENLLEFIAMLEGEPRLLGDIPFLSEWDKLGKPR